MKRNFIITPSHYLCVDTLGATQRLIKLLKERRTNMFFKSWEACI